MASRNLLRLCLFLAIGVTAAGASVTVSVDVLDVSDDPPQLPMGIVPIDIFVDMSSDDAWTTGGLYGRFTPQAEAAGAFIRYARDDDPTTPQLDLLLNPGPSGRFTTFVTKPRNRDSIRRYTDAGAVITGGYVGVEPVATLHELDVRWTADPPEGPASPRGIDGFIVRITLDTGIALPYSEFEAGPRNQAQGPIVFESVVPGGGMPGTVSASYNEPTFTGLDWAVWYIPEPAPFACLLIAAVALRSR